MTTIRCKGLLLDMDGVLVDSTPAVARVWSRWALRHGFDPVWATQKAHGRTSLSTIQELLHSATPEMHLAEDAWMEREEIADTDGVIALPGTERLLSTLPASRIAVVTSATRELAEVRLRAAGLLRYVQNMITATDITRSKPDPEPYLKGAAKLGYAPADCLVVEDATSGVRSGKAARCRVLAIRTTTYDSELLAAGADWIVNDMAALTVLTDSPAEGLTLQLADGEERRVPQMS